MKDWIKENWDLIFAFSFAAFFLIAFTFIGIKTDSFECGAINLEKYRTYEKK